MRATGTVLFLLLLCSFVFSTPKILGKLQEAKAKIINDGAIRTKLNTIKENGKAEVSDHLNNILNLKTRGLVYNSSIIDSNTGLNIYQFLEKHNYTYENHTITTEDGYILTTFRIPNGRNETPRNTSKPAALLLHGIWSNPQDLILRTDKSIGFMLAENGFDVWLMASRGNTYSLNHTTLDNNSDEFWDFSWHEVGYYDIPANIEHIKNVTGQNSVTFLGHSQGGTAYVAMAAARPEYNSRITLSVLMAPVVYLSNAKLPVLPVFEQGYELLIAAGKLLKLKDIFPYSPVIVQLAKIFCNEKSPILKFCKDAIGLFTGPDPTQLSDNFLTVMGSNDPAGGSFKQVLHYLQVARTGDFRFYNYENATENQKMYGQDVAPKYNLTAATAPVGLFYGANDRFVDIKDALILANQLPNVIKKLVTYPLMNHIDFVFAKDVDSLVNNDIIELVNKYNNL